MKTLVVGLGNPILTDDGVGVLVAAQVATRIPPTHWSEITVTEASLGGLRLMELMLGYERVILIDAILPSPDIPVGSWFRTTLDEMHSEHPTFHSTNTHDMSIGTAIEMGRRMGLPLPDEIIIYAIGVANVTDFGDQPSKVVSEAIPRVAEAVLVELGLTNEENHSRIALEG